MAQRNSLKSFRLAKNIPALAGQQWDFIDPYSQTRLAGRNVAALLIGRSLARFRWHLTQQVLLSYADCVQLVTDPDKYRPQSALAVSALESIYARADCLEVNAVEAVCSAIQRCIEVFTSFEFGEQCCDALKRAASAQWATDDFDANAEIIEQTVMPQYELVRKAIGDAIDEEQRLWFTFGQVLEQGQCRPDVHRYMAPFLNGASILRVDGFTRDYHFELVGWDDCASKSTRREAVSDFHPLAAVSREPGDLMPQTAWYAQLKRLLRVAELEETAQKSIEQLQKAAGCGKLRRDELLKAIEELFRMAHFAAGRGLERLRIDLEHNIVELDGKKYQVTKQQALLFQELKSAGDNFSFPELIDTHTDAFGVWDKLKKVQVGLPPELFEIIAKGRGKKTRLIL